VATRIWKNFFGKWLQEFGKTFLEKWLQEIFKLKI